MFTVRLEVVDGAEDPEALARRRLLRRDRRRAVLHLLGGVDGAPDGGERCPAREEELHGAAERGAGGERGRHEARSGRGVSCGEAHDEEEEQRSEWMLEIGRAHV